MEVENEKKTVGVQAHARMILWGCWVVHFMTVFSECLQPDPHPEGSLLSEKKGWSTQTLIWDPSEGITMRTLRLPPQPSVHD